ncbi:MAG: M20 family peptidase [Candidatus Hydrogenedentes bacterium]|nr:M20 family peptidase [Candidatus Hydrogenedentota bacterium]
MKKFILAVLLVIVVLGAVVLTRALMMTPVQVQAAPVTDIDVDARAAAEHLGAAIRFPTISFGVSAPLSKDDFEAFHAYLETTYPQTHATLKRELVGGFTLLYTWQGTNAGLKPLVVLGHFDVVPVPPGTEQDWTHPPFGGEIHDGVVWGRGAADDKQNVIGAMEAVEWLIAKGFTPKRTVILSFGHDEELGGPNGAQGVVALMKERGIAPECVVDEGGSILEGKMPGVNEPTALIGIAEKGYVSFSLTANHEGGHSSTPPKHSAIGILAEAITKIENNPFPGSLSGPTKQMFAAVGPEMPLGQRIVFANLWLFRPIVERLLSGSPETNAVVRTTTAVTMIDGGVKDNVLPPEAKAVVNVRILPGESADSAKQRLIEIIADDRVKIEAIEKEPRDPSPVSDVNAASYKLLERTVREVCPDVIVAPFLVLGGTDSRHFYDVTPNVYRFVPARFKGNDLAMVHGVNERMRVENFAEICRFYVQLIRNFDAAS